MITVDSIVRCSGLTTQEVEQALKKNYPQDSIRTSKFIGITNTGEFAYKCHYFDRYEGMEQMIKVFVWEKGNGELVAQY